MANIFWGQVLPALVSLAAAAFCYGIGVLCNWIKQKSDIDGDAHINNSINMAINTSQQVVNTVVGKTEQMVAEQLRQDVKDGVKPASEMQRLGALALDEVMQILGSETRELLHLHFGDVEGYITGLIENAVYQLKQNKKIKFLPMFASVGAGDIKQTADNLEKEADAPNAPQLPDMTQLGDVPKDYVQPEITSFGDAAAAASEEPKDMAQQEEVAKEEGVQETVQETTPQDAAKNNNDI